MRGYRTTRDSAGTIRSLPKVSVGIGKGPGVVSVGGRVGKYGGAVGIDKGKPFGSANIGGKVVASFGPQDQDELKKKKRK